MTLGSLLSVAGSGIAGIDAALAVVGQNVANAGTPDWTAEVATQGSATAGGIGMGARVLPTRRELDTQLQSGVFAENASVAGLQTRQAALSGIDSVQGAVGAGNDLASLVGALGDAFSALSGDPSNQTQQQAVVAAAASLSGQLNALSGAVQSARQGAQDAAVGEVASLNADLAQVGTLSAQIERSRQNGQSTADLENQRDAVVDTISTILPVKQVAQPGGGVLLVAAGGLTLPTTGGTPLAMARATMGATATYPADPGVPGVTLNGVDVTRQLGGSGQLGANLTLRDGTLPTYQANLDEFAHTLAGRFDQQGLRLFSDASGNLPAATGSPYAQSGYVGFASSITVNPAVVATPSLARDGTQSPATGLSGYTGIIDKIVTYALGSQSAAGVAQAAPSGTGLGPAGTLSSGFTAPADLGGYAAALVGAMAQDGSQTAGSLASAQAVQGSLQAKLTSGSGVSIDREMSTMIELQNAYGANAKVISTVQALWSDLQALIQ